MRRVVCGVTRQPGAARRGGAPRGRRGARPSRLVLARRRWSRHRRSQDAPGDAACATTSICLPTTCRSMRMPNSATTRNWRGAWAGVSRAASASRTSASSAARPSRPRRRDVAAALERQLGRAVLLIGAADRPVARLAWCCGGRAGMVRAGHRRRCRLLHQRRDFRADRASGARIRRALHRGRPSRHRALSASWRWATTCASSSVSIASSSTSTIPV